MQDESRNTIIFVVCALALFLLYNFFVLEPASKRRQAETAHAAAVAQLQSPAAAAVAGGVPVAPPVITRQAALAASPRVPVDTPSLKGSVALRGGRIDDLYLKQYRETVDKNSPPVELLRPEGVAHAWFADLGWTGANVAGLPAYNTVWTLAQGSTLTPGQPIVLTYDNGQGLTFTRKIEVDDKFMFTVTDTVANSGAAPVTLVPYGSIQRQGLPDHPANSQIVHEGAVGALGLDKPILQLIDYKKWSKDGGAELDSKGGWLGITDKYWLAAVAPAQTERVHGRFDHRKEGGLDLFAADYTGQPRVVAPGGQSSNVTHVFAGAKTVPVLRAYEQKLGIPRFDDAVDWGRYFFWLTRPIFSLLMYIYQHVGTFGIAILVLTVVVRGVFFPLANKSYESMSKMKKVQPLVEEMRKKYKDDPAKQQQEMLALYSREKVNPLAGCLPILLQIPVFYSLYKVLTVTIEMRHAPFLGWIQDLSARDPTTVWNLFGLIPWNPAHLPMIGGILDTSLHIGVMPLIYGLTMWLSTSMNPPAPDPAQQKIFQLMPIIFTFIMAPFAVGLLIYWTWSNVLTTLQQYVIMRRFKVDNPIDRIINRLTGRAGSHA
ncbi:MAG: preprotein translocase subunit [Phenylobacterium sp.]|nr:preprotein translocase subunit [Phenylobacterium sp.]